MILAAMIETTIAIEMIDVTVVAIEIGIADTKLSDLESQTSGRLCRLDFFVKTCVILRKAQP